ncbi:hypothetical protein TWF788_011620 [Orbilia oligospora]|uniref:DUF7580 domain-containing protein n=1 Tax=Orbilia oligospora TaxID=2813651 RepID=A0A7C8KKR0_ORBOL|nr:hypothetical protein TWF788_011620 [Orbilia oligospora]
MVHSCETGGDHVLDERIPEWQLLQDIRPLFASSPIYQSSLQWKVSDLEDRSGSSGEIDKHMRDWEIKATNDVHLFKHEMRGLPKTAPQVELTCEDFEDCLNRLHNLLDLLNQLIRDSIFEHKLSRIETAISLVNARGAGQNDHNRTTADNATEEVQDNISSVGAATSSPPLRRRRYVTSYFSNPFKDFKLKKRKFLKLKALSGGPRVESAPVNTDSVHNYPKLRALGNIVNAASQDGKYVVEECVPYINIVQTAEVYARGSQILEAFNARFEKLNAPHSNQSSLSGPITIPKTNWRDSEPAAASNRLFKILDKNIRACGDKTGHQAMLCLSDIQLNARPLIFNMFFLTCESPSYWQDSRFNTISSYRDMYSQRVVENLCKLIYEHRQELQSSSTALNLFFDEEKLFVVRTDLFARRDVFPAISLKELLSRGYFRKPTAGGAFGSRDKAALALSLARCLLHLLQGPWIKRPWTADSFQFLHNKETDELLDVHHPYIHWPREQFAPHGTEDETIESITIKCREIFLEFACLLLEIQIGGEIAFDHLPSMDLKGREDILYEKVDNPSSDEALAYYYSAVEGCLKFKAYLASHRKCNGAMPLEEQIRKVVYSNVITPLEQQLSIFPNPRTLQIQHNLQLQNRLVKPINPGQPTKYTQLQRGPQVQRSPPPTSKTSLEVQREIQQNESLSYPEDFILANLKALEDRSYPNPEKTPRKPEADGFTTDHNQNPTSVKKSPKPEAYDVAVLCDDDWPSRDSPSELKEGPIAPLKHKLENILGLVTPMNPPNVMIRFVNYGGDCNGTQDNPPIIDLYRFKMKPVEGGAAPKSLGASLDERIVQPLVVRQVKNGRLKNPLIIIVLLGTTTIIDDQDSFKKIILSCKQPDDIDEYSQTAVVFIFSGISSIVHKPTQRFLIGLGKYKELREWVFYSTRTLDESCAVMQRAVAVGMAHKNPRYAKQLFELFNGVLEN